MSVMTGTAGSGLHVHPPYDDALIATVHDATPNHIAPAMAVAIRAATESLDTATHHARRVETEGAMINEDSNFRIDQMLFGGVKGQRHRPRRRALRGRRVHPLASGGALAQAAEMTCLILFRSAVQQGDTP
jgi:hypothetical protein